MEENTKKMLAGKPYRPDTEELKKISSLAHRLSRDYNMTTDEDEVERKAIIDRLFPNHGQNVYLQGPIEVDYGQFTHLGDNFYSNFNLTILDTCPVTIGNNVMCGPNVTFATPSPASRTISPASSSTPSAPSVRRDCEVSDWFLFFFVLLFFCVLLSAYVPLLPFCILLSLPLVADVFPFRLLHPVIPESAQTIPRTASMLLVLLIVFSFSLLFRSFLCPSLICILCTFFIHVPSCRF